MNSYHSPELASDTHPWGGVTDPTLHVEGVYWRYQVHGISFASANGALLANQDKANGVAYDPTWGDQSISMYAEPERVAERVTLSTSLIDSEHSNTYGLAGIIVEAPEENVLVTSSGDAGAHNNNLNAMLKRAAQTTKLDPDELLARSSTTIGDECNEVVLRCSDDGKRVQLKGFFYKTNEDGTPLSRQLTERMREHALRLGLPVVAIQEEGSLYANMVDKRPDLLAVQVNGCRYFLDARDELRFRIVNGAGQQYFMSPVQWHTAVDYGLRSGELSAIEAEQYTTAYNEASRRRQIPTVRFKEDGSVYEISCYAGYGEEEEKTSVNDAGFGEHVNVAEETRVMNEYFASEGQMFDDTDYVRYGRRLSGQESTELIKAAIDNLDNPQAKDRVRLWYADHFHTELKLND